MAGSHLDRLSVVDNSFLDLERDATHMHVGGLMVFDGPAPECGDVLRHIEARLPLVPRYRQRIAHPPLRTGRPVWIDDPCFNLDYHVRHTALPSPGGDDQLRKLTARVFSQRLDRSKPLWEIWLVEGLDHGRFALINKAHHALIDGMSGVDLVSLLFDATPEPQPPPAVAATWSPQHTTNRDLLGKGLRDAVETPAALGRRAVDAVRRPRRVLRGVRDSAQGIAEILGPGVVRPAPDVPLNTRIGPHRRVWWVSTPLDDFKSAKNALGGTVNDVVLAVVSGALRRWLQDREAPVADLVLRALVPVSVRSDAEQYQLGNRVAAMRAPLPVHVADPVRRLQLVSEAMGGLKQSKQALGAERIAALQEFAPPTLLAQAARVNFSTRLFNVIVTNVPGPQIPIYLLGRQMQEIVPFAFLPKDHALAFAIMSYNGKVDFGLLGDYDAMPDLEGIAGHLEAALDELRTAARNGVRDQKSLRARRSARRAKTGARR